MKNTKGKQIETNQTNSNFQSSIIQHLDQHLHFDLSLSLLAASSGINEIISELNQDQN
jgi:hypothetical protein